MNLNHPEIRIKIQTKSTVTVHVTNRTRNASAYVSLTTFSCLHVIVTREHFDVIPALIPSFFSYTLLSSIRIYFGIRVTVSIVR